MRRLGVNVLGARADRADLGSEFVDFGEVGAHALHHDALLDVHHVRVAHLAAIDDIGHLHAALQFVLLRYDGEDTHFALVHVCQHLGRHIWRGPPAVILQTEGGIAGTHLFDLPHQGGRNLLAHLVGDDGNSLGGIDA